MSRSVVYLTNEHPFYVKMLVNSIEMLVSNLKTPLPIRVLVIKDRSSMTIERGTFGQQGTLEGMIELYGSLVGLGVEILEREPAYTGEGNFFHAQRAYLYGIPEESVLYIDADTFIFGDVNDLFDAHAEHDFVAAEAEWVKGREYPSELFHPDVRPFSSGVLLWNRGWHKDWASELPTWMRRFRTKEHPLSEWLYEQHMDCLLREEFAATAWVDSRRDELKWGYFAPEEVQLIRYSSDFEKLGQQTIFHCYTPNWKEARNRLDGVSKPKIPKLRLKR